MRGPFFIIGVLLIGQSAFGQLAVQQPVVGTTSINTTVTVPDRGSTYLGGVSSAQSGRSQYGPLRSGTSTGFTRQSSSMSTSVYIHDLRAMDEAILNSVGRSAGTERTSSSASLEVVTSPAEKRKKFEDLAQKAEAAGKDKLAKLHWQMAAKYGSSNAEKRLAKLAVPAPLPVAQSAPREKP